MKLTGKCKEAFEEWFNNTQSGKSIHNLLSYDLKDYPENMKWGVYQDFFIDIDYIIEIAFCDEWMFNIDRKGFDSYSTGWDFENIKQARSHAVLKANELFNKQIN